MIKILFLINTLGGGGAERVLVNLVNNMDTSAFDITVETMFDDGISASLLNKNIRLISKNAPCPHGIAYVYRILPAKTLYKYFIGNERYDIIVAYMHGAPVKVISGCTDKRIKKLAWIHNGHPATSTMFNFWKSKNEAFSAYAVNDAIIGVSRSVSSAFSEYTGIYDNIHTVYNTNDVSQIKKMSEEPVSSEIDKDTFNIVSVGRLSKEKRFDKLLFICKKLRDECFIFNVNIIGTGSEEANLKNLIKEYNAEEWFKLIGYQSNPYKYVNNSDLYVCSSKSEGLSTAVTEAVILGVPVVSTDVSGAKEILGENNEYGIVTENSEDGIYNGIKEMLSDKEKLAYYAGKAKERASFFATEKTVKEAESIFYQLFRS